MQKAELLKNKLFDSRTINKILNDEDSETINLVVPKAKYGFEIILLLLMDDDNEDRNNRKLLLSPEVEEIGMH